jgi:hypothetical protein
LRERVLKREREREREREKEREVQEKIIIATDNAGHYTVDST